MLANVTRLFNTRIRPNLLSFLLIVVGVVLFLIDLFIVVDQSFVLQLIVAALLLIIFRDTKPQVEPVIHVAAPEVKITPDIAEVLRDRKKYSAYPEFLGSFAQGVHSLWIYGASAVVVNANEMTIRKAVLEKSGSLRVMFQDILQQPYVDEVLKRQLDEQEGNFLGADIERTRASLLKLQRDFPQTVEFDVLPYSPGFSMTVVNHDRFDGLVIVELFGFNLASRHDRMHILIRRVESEEWFTYWVRQYQKMWETTPAGRKQMHG